MSVKVSIKLNVGDILRKRGLGDSDGARTYLAERVRARSDPYVPMQQGTLKNTAQISPGGTQVIYKQPYAHYQYKGKVMGPNVLLKVGWRSMARKGGKRYTGGNLTIRKQDTGLRGPEWDKRMLANHRGDLEKDVAAYVGGKTK